MLKNTSSDPQLVEYSVFAYQILSAFYLARFREAYNAQMSQVFRDWCLETYFRSGFSGMLKLWARAFFDWIKTVIEQQLHKGTEMTNMKFVRLSGWGLVLAAVSFLLTFLTDAAEIQIWLFGIFGTKTSGAELNLYRSISDVIAMMPFFLGVVLVILGILSLQARYGKHVRPIGSFALGAGALFGASALVGLIGMMAGIESAGSLAMPSIALMFTGLFVFGLTAIKAKPMENGNFLPMLAGFWHPMIVFGANLNHLLTGNWLEVPGWLSFSIVRCQTK
ncbi:MAG: hypothetical protein DWG76_08415 [Chloroflexi bacterium]|nr:hypothetical protein [Chloroflexota bacterium]